MKKEITPAMVDALVKEIEEPLITADELAPQLGMETGALTAFAIKLKIKAYKMKDGRAYKCAYDEVMVRKIIEARKNIQAVIRKNKLDIGKLL